VPQRRRSLKSTPSATAQMSPPGDNVQAQLQNLIQQKKYKQAIDEIQRIRRTQPDLEISPSEPEIWVLRGRQEFEQNRIKDAESSFRRALALGITGESHYWIARSLIKQNRDEAALTLIEDAFNQGQLPKEYGICYLKLLLIQGNATKVEELVTKQSKRFLAAQLHWAKGILALKADKAVDALVLFQKVKRPLTSGDVPEAWVVYSQQLAKKWDAAAATLGLRPISPFPFAMVEPRYLKKPILRRLAIRQQAQTSNPPLKPMDLQQNQDSSIQEALTALAIAQLIESQDYHNAAHALLNLERRPTQIPELNSFKSNLLALAGEQAIKDGEPHCTETFWEPLLTESFNPQLAVNLMMVYEMNESDSEAQRLITRIIKWVKSDAQKNPEQWSEQRLALTLAHLHCRLADAWLGQGKERAALGELQQAERICPTSPEVSARKGLQEFSEGNIQGAIQMLTQAMEGEAHMEEAYSTLLECYDELRDPQAKLEARQKFGKNFGDMNPEAEIVFPAWLDALYSQKYSFFRKIVDSEEEADPPLRVCQLFVECAGSEVNSGGRVLLDQDRAKKVWDALLSPLQPEEKILPLQAIALSTLLFARKEKGVAALVNRYLDQLQALGKEFVQAQEAQLVALAVKGATGQKFEATLRSYTDRLPDPGNALAQIQLQVRRHGWFRTLIPMLIPALEREPQNPLLLLARATTYPPHMAEYEKLKQQGFEIARRIQDAKALQAFREEQAFLEVQRTMAVMPDPDKFDPMDMGAMNGMIEAMIRQMFGSKLPPGELERMMPELKRMMMNQMPMFEDYEDDEDYEDEEDDFFGFPDFPPIFSSPPKNKKQKRDFRTL
jgi:tetratricopeptide (TPR) repeat protein